MKTTIILKTKTIITSAKAKGIRIRWQWNVNDAENDKHEKEIMEHRKRQLHSCGRQKMSISQKKKKEK